jgi:hypothetical protein
VGFQSLEGPTLAAPAWFHLSGCTFSVFRGVAPGCRRVARGRGRVAGAAVAVEPGEDVGVLAAGPRDVVFSPRAALETKQNVA